MLIHLEELLENQLFQFLLLQLLLDNLLLHKLEMMHKYEVHLLHLRLHLLDYYLHLHPHHQLQLLLQLF
jgi:hypothetical protein